MSYQTRPVDLELLEREKAALFASQLACEERDSANLARRPASNPSLWQRIKEWVLRARKRSLPRRPADGI